MHPLLRRAPLASIALAAACMPCRVQPAAAVPQAFDVRETAADAAIEAAIEDAPMDTARIVEVRMVTTQEGASGEFAPRVVRVRQGDVLRFRMADGNSIHNVSFTFVGNDTRGAPLPPDGPFLTKQGQSWQVRVDLLPGTYKFTCIPHDAAGHRGTLVVEP